MHFIIFLLGSLNCFVSFAISKSHIEYELPNKLANEFQSIETFEPSVVDIQYDRPIKRLFQDANLIFNHSKNEPSEAISMVSPSSMAEIKYESEEKFTRSDIRAKILTEINQSNRKNRVNKNKFNLHNTQKTQDFGKITLKSTESNTEPYQSTAIIKNNKTVDPNPYKSFVFKSTENPTKTKITQWKINHWNSVLSVFVIGVLAVLAISVAENIGASLNNDLKRTLDAIFRDTIVLAVIIMVSGVLNYYDLLVFLQYYINLQEISIGLLIFGMLWALLGVLLITLAHVYSKDWHSYEQEYPKREVIFRHFEDLFYNPDHTAAMKSEIKHRRHQLEFFLLRQEFITPSFLPVFGEDFLRDDFSLASYLSKCISKVNQEALRFDIATFITFSLAVGIGAGVYFFIRHLMVRILILSPVVFYIILRILARKTMRIYSHILKLL